MDLKATKELLELSKSANKQLSEKLRGAKKQIAELRAGSGDEKAKQLSAPAFLSADDPMDELFRNVGRLGG